MESGMIAYISFSIVLLFFLVVFKSQFVKNNKKTKASNDSSSISTALQLSKKPNSPRLVESWLNDGRKIYRGKSHLMTPTEQKFYYYLKQQFGADKRIFAQVRVVDLIQVNWSELKKGSNEAQSAFRQLSQWHVDYVITNQDFQIICAAELDDKSHQKPERQRRDRILNMAFETAEVKLYRYQLKKNDPRLLVAP